MLWSPAPRSSGGDVAEIRIDMDTKFSTFIKTNKINPSRLVAISRKLERLRPEDRKIKLQQRQSKAEAAAQAGGATETKPGTKPRSGRPVTVGLVTRATEGKPLTGPAKTRLLRAVNRVLEQKKKSAVELKALF